MSDGKKLQPSKIKEIFRSSGKVVCQAVVPNDVSADDVLKPDFYALVSSRFEQSGFLPEIEIVPEDLSWYMRVVVTSYGTTHAVVKELIRKEFEDTKYDVAPEDDSGYTVKFRGPSHKHCVLSPSGDVIASGLSKSAAQKQLEEHLKVIGK